MWGLLIGIGIVGIAFSLFFIIRWRKKVEQEKILNSIPKITIYPICFGSKTSSFIPGGNGNTQGSSSPITQY